MLTLAQRSFGRVRWLFVSIAIVLTAFQLALIGMSAAFARQGDFERLVAVLPAFIRDAHGWSLASFAGMITLTYYEPLPVMLFVMFAIYLATEPAGEVESGLVDLVLARPLPRAWLVTRTLMVIVLTTVTLMLSMGVTTWLGLHWLAPADARWPSARDVTMLMGYLLGVAWCFGAIALAAAAWARRRSASMAPVALAAVTLYLLEMVGDAWAPVRPLAVVSPFHYFPGSAFLQGTTNDALNLSVLGAVTGTAVALAYWQFNRRDL